MTRGARTAGRLWLLVLLWAGLGGLPAASGAHAQVGTPVAQREMPKVEGGKAPLLGDTPVNILVFIRPGQERSVTALKELARCRNVSTRTEVRWTVVVSGSATKDAVSTTLRASGASMAAVVDEDDMLYGELGLSLHPVAIVVGPNRTLAAFEPLRSVNYCAVVTARVRRALGEIGDDEMQRALAPPRAVQFGDAQSASRYRALAAALFKAGNNARALQAVRRSLEADPGSAAAQALLGDILAAEGQCDEAAAAYRKAAESGLSGIGASSRAEGCTQ